MNDVRSLKKDDIDNIHFTKQTAGSPQTTMLRKEDGRCIIWTKLWKFGLGQVDSTRENIE